MRPTPAAPERGPLAATTAVPPDPDPAYRRRVLAALRLLEPEPGESALDLGCGLGFFSSALRRVGIGEPVAVDVEIDRLVRARKEGGLRRVTLADAARLPFASGSFDKIVMTEVLEHLADDRGALLEVHRLLRPGGRLVLTVPHADYPFLWDPVGRVRTWLGAEPLRSGRYVGIWTGHRRLYLRPDLVARVESAGLEVLRIEACTHACLPFHHYLVYGIGRSLYERGVLPRSWRRALDRHRRVGEARVPFLLGALQAVIDRVDARNDRAGVERRRRFVHLVLCARRPAAP